MPGEVGIWILVGGDLTMFALLFGAFLVARGNDAAAFAHSQAVLNSALAMLNTCLLLTSSRFMAAAVRLCRSGERGKERRLIRATILCGALFAVLKLAEYRTGLAIGLTPFTNDFFMFYYVITGLHLAHLVAGMVFLYWLTRGPFGARLDDLRLVEVGATYWHSIDILWVIIFPLLYLAN